MDEPVPYEPIQEPLDDEERELMDEDNWDWDNPIEAIIAPNSLAVFPIKVTFEEPSVIAQAARDAGLTTSGFIKQAALAAARQSQHRAQPPLRAPRAATG
jgi:hypothetical protein